MYPVVNSLYRYSYILIFKDFAVVKPHIIFNPEGSDVSDFFFGFIRSYSKTNFQVVACNATHGSSMYKYTFWACQLVSPPELCCSLAIIARSCDSAAESYHGPHSEW